MRLTFLLAFAVAALSPAAGQNPPPDQHNPVIRSSVKEVLLDLVVRDKHHILIHDLKRGDVEVYEDGVKQDLRNFRLVGGKEARESEDNADQQTAGAKRAINPLRELNLVSLVFDQMGSQNRRNAKDAADAFLNNELRSNTFIGVFSLDYKLHAIEQFSSNRDLLRKAVERVSTGAYSQFRQTSDMVLRSVQLPIGRGSIGGASLDYRRPAAGTAPAEFPGMNTGETTAASIMYGILSHEQIMFNTIFGSREMDSLLNMVQQMSSLPGRKTVLLLSEGLVIPAGHTEMFRELISAANRANVSIYAIDVNGLTTASAQQAGAAIISDLQTAPTGGVENVASGPSLLADDKLQYGLRAANLQATLAELAEDTGGFLIANTNDFKKPLRRIMEDVRTHYEVAYSPASDNYDGHFRKIEVKLLRARLTVQSRSGYFALPDLEGRPLQVFEVAGPQALDSKPLPRAFDFQAAALRFRPGYRTVQYVLMFEMPYRNLKAREEVKSKTHAIHASFLALIKNAQGQVVEKISRDIPASVPDDKFAAFSNGRLIYTQAVELNPGRYTLETVVVDREGQQASAKRSALVVTAPTGPELSNIELVRRFDRLETTPDPFQFHGGKVTPSLAGPAAGSGQVGIYFVVYPSATTEKSDVMFQFIRDGVPGAKQTPALPAPDESGAIPVMISAKLEAGEYEARVTVRQGAAATERGISFVVP